MANNYIVEFTHNGKSRFCIWFTDEVDGFIIEQNEIISFSNIESATNYCYTRKMKVGKDITTYDVDNILEIVNSNTPTVDCKSILDFWNIVMDVTSSVSDTFYGNEEGIVTDIYNKLFYGNNLPAMNDTGENFVPEWGSEDIFEFKKVVEDAVRIITTHIKWNFYF